MNGNLKIITLDTEELQDNVYAIMEVEEEVEKLRKINYCILRFSKEELKFQTAKKLNKLIINELI